MNQLNIEVLDPIKLPLIKPIYKAHYPAAKAKKNETIIIGSIDKQIVALLRFRPIEQYQLLTGMLVLPAYRQQGFALQLLDYCRQQYLNSNTYCFAYCHLQDLYQKAGFTSLSDDQLPPMLHILFARYTANGKKLLAMQYKLQDIA